MTSLFIIHSLFGFINERFPAIGCLDLFLKIRFLIWIAIDALINLIALL